MEVIKIKDKVSCIIFREEDWTEGLNFITPDDMFIQVGTWWYDKDKELQKHKHKEFLRTANRTQESVYVKKGALRVDLYTEELEKFREFVLVEGELAVFGYGGHGYCILEDSTQVIETKNGPFVDVDTDKLKF
jgi:predicted KAP-like P-loop ATPase